MTSMMWLVVAGALLLLSIALQADATALIPRQKCKPNWGVNNATCTRLIQNCWGDWRIKLKWTDTGIGNGGQRLRDAGCQCDQYCGFKTANACNKDKQCYWKPLGKVGACFNRLTGKRGGTTKHVCPQSPDGLQARDISVSENFTCAVTLSGAAKCWGFGGFGSLGNSENASSNVPVQVTGLSSGVTSICTGYVHACAVKDGAAKCWGNNDVGQLGDGTNNPSKTPVQVVGLTSKVTRVACGELHSCALLSDKTVKCWGFNSAGQLGDNTTTDRAEPVSVVSLTNVNSLALGPWQSCATIQSSTQTWCWGFNARDEFGMGTADGTFLVPTRMINEFRGGSISSLSAGHYHTCAINGTGAALCVGADNNGQLGDGDLGGSDRHIPVVPIGFGAKTISISSSWGSSCGVLATGECRCWGGVLWGLYGDNTFPQSGSPLTVVGTQDHLKVSVALDHACSIRKNYAVTCWGRGGVGQLGNGAFSIDTSLGPVFVWSGD